MNVYQRPLFMQAGGPVMQPGMQQAMPQPMMDPGMAAMPPDVAQQAGVVEQEAAARAQQLSSQYLDTTMQSLDAAETSEDVINAIRGNVQPLEARYRELAELVGEEDAGATPQSVLALVQPIILMTEQGAMDSGVGGLMQSLVGEVEMALPDGTPSDMGQGIGGLMMAGAGGQNAAPQAMGVGQPPVANFSQGGSVQRFQEGGEASRLQQLYSEMLPVYQGIMGDGEEQKRMTQAQILFDIADRAGAFAAGIDPRTGQRLSGSSAAQLSGALSGLGGQIGERLGAQEQQSRALKMAALQGAQGEFSAERAAARASAGRERGIGEAYEAIDADGNVVAREFLSNRSDLDAFKAANPNASVRVAQASGGLTEKDFFTKFGMTKLQFESLSDEDQRRLQGLAPEIGADIKGIPANVFSMLSAEDQRRVILGDTSPGAVNGIPRDIYDSLSDADQQKVLGTAPKADADIKGIPANVFSTLSAEDQRRVILGDTSPGAVSGIPRDIFDRLSDADQQRVLGIAPEPPSGSFINIELPGGDVRSVREDSPEAERLIGLGGIRVSTTGARAADPLTNPDIMSQYAAGTLLPAEEAAVQAAIAEKTRSVFNAETGRYEQPTITPLVQQAENARRDLGMSTVLAFPDEGPAPAEGAGRERSLSELGGAAFGTGPFFKELANAAFALVDVEALAPQTQAGVRAVDALNQDALIAFREVTGGRTAQEAVNQFQNILPTPAKISGTPGSAAAEIQQVINLFNANIQNARESLSTGVASQADRQLLEQGIISAQSMVRSYGALLEGIQRAAGSAANPADFRR